jgi:hypothetical protein
VSGDSDVSTNASTHRISPTLGFSSRTIRSSRLFTCAVSHERS